MATDYKSFPTKSIEIDLHMAIVRYGSGALVRHDVLDVLARDR